VIREPEKLRSVERGLETVLRAKGWFARQIEIG